MAELARVLGGLTAAALLAASPAFATGEPPAPAAKTAADLSGVTVTAQKPDPIANTAREFVRSRLATNRNAQYARFRDPVCVRVLGLPAEFDAFVAQRVTALAREVKAPVDTSSSCTPNVNVIFSPKPQDQLSDIAKRRDILFGYYFKTNFKTLSTFSRPIQSWYLTRTVDTTGKDILELNDQAPCVDTPSEKCGLKAPAVMGKAGSRLGNDMSSELVHSLILADATKVSGEKIGAVADYIAVLALSRWTGVERCSGVSTILNLMAEGCEADEKPEAATPEDVALLTGLYAVAPREVGTMQRAEIASRLDAELKKGSH